MEDKPPSLADDLEAWRSDVLEVRNAIGTYRESIEAGDSLPPRSIPRPDDLDARTRRIVEAIPTIKPPLYSMPIHAQAIADAGALASRWQRSPTQDNTPTHETTAATFEAGLLSAHAAIIATEPPRTFVPLPPAPSTDRNACAAVEVLLTAREQLTSVIASAPDVHGFVVFHPWHGSWTAHQNGDRFESIEACLFRVLIGDVARVHVGDELLPILLYGRDAEALSARLQTIVSAMPHTLRETGIIGPGANHLPEPWSEGFGSPLNQWLNWLIAIGSRFGLPGNAYACEPIKLLPPHVLDDSQRALPNRAECITFANGGSVHRWDFRGDPLSPCPNRDFMPIYEPVLEGALRGVAFIRDVFTASRFAIDVLLRLHAAKVASEEASKAQPITAATTTTPTAPKKIDLIRSALIEIDNDDDTKRAAGKCGPHTDTTMLEVWESIYGIAALMRRLNKQGIADGKVTHEEIGRVLRRKRGEIFQTPHLRKINQAINGELRNEA